MCHCVWYDDGRKRNCITNSADMYCNVCVRDCSEQKKICTLSSLLGVMQVYQVKCTSFKQHLH